MGEEATEGMQQSRQQRLLLFRSWERRENGLDLKLRLRVGNKENTKGIKR